MLPLFWTTIEKFRLKTVLLCSHDWLRLQEQPKESEHLWGQSTRQISSRVSNNSSNFLKETKPIMMPALHSDRLDVNWCERRQHLDFSFKLSFFHCCYPRDPHLHESSVWVIYPLGWRVRCQNTGLLWCCVTGFQNLVKFIVVTIATWLAKKLGQLT